MTSHVKTTLWLLLSVASGATGFYFGIGEGANILARMATQNAVSEALGQIDSSLAAIDKNDLAYSQNRHRLDLHGALFKLGTNAEQLPYWTCRERDRRIIEAARVYVAAHPTQDDPLTASALARALHFCERG